MPRARRLFWKSRAYWDGEASAAHRDLRPVWQRRDGRVGIDLFRQHPPLPLKEIAANLEFEMIGRPDPAVKDDTLWLTGWERSNLGPALAARGARLVA